MRQIVSRISLMLIVSIGLLSPMASAADKKSSPNYENQLLRLRLFPRSTEQMAGFFEARGFPLVMIQRLSEYCFFTVVIKNKTNGKLKLDLSEWNFATEQGGLTRIPRSTWPPIWKELNIPLAAQATFRWTLLPEELHFYANESEGGNIILQKTNEPFILRARFVLGETSTPMLATVNNLRCADVAEEKQ